MSPSLKIIGPYALGPLLRTTKDVQTYQASGTDGRVALKVATSSTGERLLKGEALALRQAPHPHMVRLVKLDSSGKWLATQWVEGTRLDRWAAGKSASALINVTLELISALLHLSQKQLHHGDLSPSNILVDRSGHPVLLDPTPNISGMTCNTTPGFTAPERLSGKPATEASEVYSLGALLRSILISDLPGGMADLRGSSGSGGLVPPLPPGAWRGDLPKGLDALILTMMSPVIALRPSLKRVAALLVSMDDHPQATPRLGNFGPRRTLRLALAQALARPTVVVCYGAFGSGRATLLREAAKLGPLVGASLKRKFNYASFSQAAAEGGVPIWARAGLTQRVEKEALAFLGAGHGGLMLIRSDYPSAPLHRAGVTHITPLPLTPMQMQQVGRWAGASPSAIHEAALLSEGNPGLFRTSLSRTLDLPTTTLSFHLPPSAMEIVTALGSHAGSLPLRALETQLDRDAAQLMDDLYFLKAQGLILFEGDGANVRLKEQGVVADL